MRLCAWSTYQYVVGLDRMAGWGRRVGEVGVPGCARAPLPGSRPKCAPYLDLDVDPHVPQLVVQLSQLATVEDSAIMYCKSSMDSVHCSGCFGHTTLPLAWPYGAATGCMPSLNCI